MTTNKTSNDIGNEAEQLAATFLESKGYIIVQRNWRYKHKEIDIICKFKNELIIVEVKYRGKNNYQSPAESVTKIKQKFLIEAANAYIETHNVNVYTRFDIIAITEKNGKTLITHLEDAFYPTL